MRALSEIVHLHGPDCRQASDAIAAIAAGEPARPRATAHVQSCLRCQAEVAAYRRVLRTLRAMRRDDLVPPPGGLAELLKMLEEEGEAGHPALVRLAGSPWAWRAAYVGGITAAGAAGMLVWYSRRRPGLPHAG